MDSPAFCSGFCCLPLSGWQYHCVCFWTGPRGTSDSLKKSLKLRSSKRRANFYCGSRDPLYRILTYTILAFCSTTILVLELVGLSHLEHFLLHFASEFLQSLQVSVGVTSSLTSVYGLEFLLGAPLTLP